MAHDSKKQCTVIVSYEVAREDADRFRLVPFPIHALAYEVVKT